MNSRQFCKLECGIPGVGRLALPNEESVHVDGAVILESLAGWDLAGDFEDGVLSLALAD